MRLQEEPRARLGITPRQPRRLVAAEQRGGVFSHDRHRVLDELRSWVVYRAEVATLGRMVQQRSIRGRDQGCVDALEYPGVDIDSVDAGLEPFPPDSRISLFARPILTCSRLPGLGGKGVASTDITLSLALYRDCLRGPYHVNTHILP